MIPEEKTSLETSQKRHEACRLLERIRKVTVERRMVPSVFDVTAGYSVPGLTQQVPNPKKTRCLRWMEEAHLKDSSFLWFCDLRNILDIFLQ